MVEKILNIDYYFPFSDKFVLYPKKDYFMNT